MSNSRSALQWITRSLGHIRSEELESSRSTDWTVFRKFSSMRPLLDCMVSKRLNILNCDGRFKRTYKLPAQILKIELLKLCKFAHGTASGVYHRTTHVLNQLMFQGAPPS